MIVSVDPGLSNGVAILDPTTDLLFTTEIEPIGEGARKRLPLAQLVDLIEKYDVTRAVIEDVGPMPGQGVTSSFRFGRATGSFEGVLSALKIPTVFILPLSGRNRWVSLARQRKVRAAWQFNAGRLQRIFSCSSDITIEPKRRCSASFTSSVS
jgi:hypothetical protein